MFYRPSFEKLRCGKKMEDKWGECTEWLDFDTFKWKRQETFSWESSRTYVQLWDCYKEKLNDKNPLLNFHLNVTANSYRQFYDKPLLKNPEHCGANFSAFDLDTLIVYQKGLNDQKRDFLYRKENLAVFTSVYGSSFYKHQANPSQPFQSRYDTTAAAASKTSNFSEIVTLSCGTDVLLTDSHSRLLLIDFNSHFKRNLFRPSLDSLIVSLTQLELRKKSEIQLVELRRAAHSYLLNFFVRLDSRKTRPCDSNKIKEFSTPKFNSGSFFLDLAHSLPYERTIYSHNSVLSFLRAKKTVNESLLWHFENEECRTVERTSDRQEHGYPRVSLNPNQTEKVAPHDSTSRPFPVTLKNPRPLAFLSALKLRKTFQNYLFSAHPLQRDFALLLDRASEYFKRAVPPFEYFLTHLVESYQKVPDISRTFPSHRNFQTHNEFTRFLELTCRPKYCQFQLKTDSDVVTLNSEFQYRPYFIVATSKFPHVLIPHNFHEFVALYNNGYERCYYSQIPTPLDSLCVTGLLGNYGQTHDSCDDDDYDDFCRCKRPSVSPSLFSSSDGESSVMFFHNPTDSDPSFDSGSDNDSDFEINIDDESDDY